MALKFAFVLILVAIIVYTFRDSAGPILAELKQTSLWVILIISISAVLYELVEGWITCSFARKYNPSFTYRMGVESAFYCSFYRVATLGSGAGVAAVYYFNEKGIEVFKGTGMYMVEYVLHKVTIALFSAIFFLVSFGFMMEHYGEYAWMLIGGYGITIVIAAALLLFCCSKRFHGLILWLVDKLNRKGRLDEQAVFLREQCAILEQAASKLLCEKNVCAGHCREKSAEVCILVQHPVFYPDGDRGGNASSGDGSHLPVRHVGGCHSFSGGNRLHGVCVCPAV